MCVSCQQLRVGPASLAKSAHKVRPCGLTLSAKPTQSTLNDQRWSQMPLHTVDQYAVMGMSPFAVADVPAYMN